MADSSSVAPDIDSELSEAENRESDTDSTTTRRNAGHWGGEPERT